MTKKRWMLTAAAALAAVSVGAGVVMAQTATDGAGTTFLDRVAQRLGIDTPKLQQALTDARADEIDQAVADGKLTQEQADKLKARLDSLPEGAFGGGLGFGFRDGPGKAFGPAGPHHGFGLGVAHEKLADFLGISVAQLGTELRAEGATLASVAEAHGKSRDDLKAFITGETKAKLDEAVAAGNLTQARADEMLTKLGERLDGMIDGTRPPFGRHFRREPFRPFEGDDAPPAPLSGEPAPASRS